MRQSKMEQLELGMSKSQVVNILGSSYSIGQKRNCIANFSQYIRNQDRKF
ncbi:MULTISPECIES: outer membrane protein assembly factor BamE domain-containing protein [unclassified Sphingobacterium]